MHKEHLEKGVDVQNPPEKYTYQHYLELGGIINENDYNSAMMRTQNTTRFNESIIRQAENIAKVGGIELHNTGDTVDPKIILYGILRSDVRPEGVKHHHQQMSDQRLFAEVLRMLEDTDALAKLKDAYHTKRAIGTHCPLCGQTKFSESCP